MSQDLEPRIKPEEVGARICLAGVAILLTAMGVNALLYLWLISIRISPDNELILLAVSFLLTSVVSKWLYGKIQVQVDDAVETILSPRKLVNSEQRFKSIAIFLFLSVLGALMYVLSTPYWGQPALDQTLQSQSLSPIEKITRIFGEIAKIASGMVFMGAIWVISYLLEPIVIKMTDTRQEDGN